jgi:hypothetical protein
MLGLLWNPRRDQHLRLAFFDGAGAPLDGSNRYVLRFDQPPPVNAFWSLTMYSAENRLFVPNAINRYSVGDRTKAPCTDEDGSLEIFLQHEEPTDPNGSGRTGSPRRRDASTSHPALLAAGRNPDRRLAAAACPADVQTKIDETKR